MPTKPNEDLLPNQDENRGIIAILAQYSLLLDEAVRFGTRVFEWSLGKVHEGDHHIAAFSLFRQSLELLDSISVLIKNSCVLPCKTLLRSLFETMLSLEYMLQSDSANRGRNYILCWKHEQQGRLKQQLEGDKLKQIFVERLKDDKVLKNMKTPPISDSDIKQAVELKEKIFKSTTYSGAEASFQEKKARRKGQDPRWWFSLNNGPENIYKLAEKLKRPAQYDLLYREWSGYSHGTESMEGTVDFRKGEIGFHQLRNPNNAEFMAFVAITFALTIFQIMLREYSADKIGAYSEWYKSEIRAGYFNTKRKRIIVQ